MQTSDNDTSFTFEFKGSHQELKAQYDFLKTMVGYVCFNLSIDEGGVPMLSGTHEQMLRALGSVWQHKISGWWNYRDLLIQYGYCTIDTFAELKQS